MYQMQCLTCFWGLAAALLITIILHREDLLLAVRYLRQKPTASWQSLQLLEFLGSNLKIYS